MNNRAKYIQEIIRTKRVRSQEELCNLLAGNGIRTTQATLSRDLKKLKITKQPDSEGDSYYVLPDPDLSRVTVFASGSHAGESILSIEFSGQMGVITTLPGCANMVGAIVDSHSHPGVMGTIAGDNILLLLLRVDAGHGSIMSFLNEILPGLGSKLTNQ